ncbi:MAG: hypothetical protein M0Z28_28505 [Rhodospirillales bacterium]|nr:hypothetical protein [Rhodospirillales bacterium]
MIGGFRNAVMESSSSKITARAMRDLAARRGTLYATRRTEGNRRNA